MSLIPAHRGYEYQDLLVAGRLVDVLLGTIVEVHVDKKLFDDDVFDDLTTLDTDCHRERVQFKHRENADEPLALSTFTTTTRALRLDSLIAAILTDRAESVSSATSHAYRVVLRDHAPTDPRLTAVLSPAAPDPGPFLATMPSIRLAFDAEALWLLNHPDSPGDSPTSPSPFAFLTADGTPFSRADLHWACRHLIIEVAAPAASGDLTAPAAAERLLLTRVREDVGAGLYPNTTRSAKDVAAALLGIARAARQDRLVVTSEAILSRTQLRSDFGAVTRANPVDHSLEVRRPSAVGPLVDSATRLSEGGGRLLLVAPPGHGKTWVCQQLLDELSRQGWLTAEHYCYLGDADGERSARVLGETLFGSLLRRLADADPRLLQEHRPLLAANEDAVVAAINRSREYEPHRPVALVVDGIDHVTRVRRGDGAFDPSLSLAEALASLSLPTGSVVIILSQPGSHLRPLEQVGATTLPLPGLDEAETRGLAARMRVIPSPTVHEPSGREPLLEDGRAAAEFLTALLELSAGNALYATYLCREALHAADMTLADPAGTLRSFPPFDGTLRSYYEHIQSTLGAEGAWIADVIALVDFALTPEELREIRPDMGHRVATSLDILTPVLRERVASGGIRIYHESFARFLREPFQSDSAALYSLLEHIIVWLNRKGLFTDARAFRSLLPLLHESGKHSEVVALVQRDFVIQAVAAGFPAALITANLALAVAAAAKNDDWPAVMRCVELSRAVATYQEERFASTPVDFADIPIALLGPRVVADRLLDDERLVLPARDGLQMCAALDRNSVTPPWRQYMTGYLREAKFSRTSYGTSSDLRVALAWLRGYLRLSAARDTTPALEAFDLVARRGALLGGSNDEGAEHPVEDAPVSDHQADWAEVARWVERWQLPAGAITQSILDTHGVAGVAAVIEKLLDPGDVCLAFAEIMALNSTLGTADDARLWASKAIAYGTSIGTAHRLLALRIQPAEFALPSPDVRDLLLTLTRAVQDTNDQQALSRVAEWLDACAVAAVHAPLALGAAEAIISGAGWYRCWLRFVIGLVRAEAACVDTRSVLGVVAVRCLLADLSPFSGQPRACDLYSIEGLIEDTIRRAIALVDDGQRTEVFNLLKQVSRSVTTSLDRELGGPLPPNLLLRIAAAEPSAIRQGIARDLILEEIETQAGERYFEDLAEYHLLAARVALASQRRDEAGRSWSAACRLLTAYGLHKDVTLYGLLDPLPGLIVADPRRGRACVAAVQPLCERVPLHTDGRETRDARIRWWALLAKADPVALSTLTSSGLFRDCNAPHWSLHSAIEELWRTSHSDVDPFVAGALRLTLDTPIERDDPAAMRRLVAFLGEAGNARVHQLSTLLLARLDERPVEYSVSNSGDLLARDDALIAQVNSTARDAHLPTIASVRGDPPGPTGPDPIGPQPEPSSFGHGAVRLAEVALPLPPGHAGLARATRLWRARPYDALEAEWAVDRFANVFGYRMIELAEASQEAEAIASLRSLAAVSAFNEQSGLLRTLAEGFERHSQTRLASIAYALTWTRARGRGGWLTFGGETEVDSLRRASQLDGVLARQMIAEEVRAVVATGGYGTYGISQALIHGLAVGAIQSPRTSSIDAAFASWNEACAVIADRIPWVHPTDDPDDPYRPPEVDDGSPVPGDLAGAFVLGTLAGLTHPGREKKRRTLLAIQLLLAERPEQTAPAIKNALGVITDPATLTWLLRVIELAGPPNAAVIDACREPLTQLAGGRYLTVRALARRLLGSPPPSLPLLTLADEALLGRPSGDIWTPWNGDPEPETGDEPSALVETVADSRLSRAEPMLPGLREAVRSRVATSLREEAFKERLRSQIRAFGDRAEQRWPDAFLAREQTVEEALQLAAAGGRAALIQTGNATSDPIQWEDALARALLNDPMLPLSIENSRQPRPPIPTPPPPGHALWQLAGEPAPAGTNDSPGNAEATQEQLLGITVAIEPADAVPIMVSGRFDGWRLVATVEKRLSWKSSRWNTPPLLAWRFRAIEARLAGDRQGFRFPPVTSGDLGLWVPPGPMISQWHRLPGTAPIIGEDFELASTGDGQLGLGIPRPLLCPTTWLFGALSLELRQDFILDDRDGHPAVAHIIWRAEYDTRGYGLPWPRLIGAAMLMRQDLFDRLPGLVEGPLVFRDFILGDSAFGSTEGSDQ